MTKLLFYGIIKIQRREENKAMTKAQMIDVIEKSGMVINFSRSYFMARPKSFVEKMYESALAFIVKNN